MGTFLDLESARNLYKFRYLQGYMGTKCRDSPRRNVSEFRYLQGYMGTQHYMQTAVLSPLFRYLQGYMGTMDVSNVVFPKLCLDTFKDIWELMLSGFSDLIFPV